jgi:hypothetical protein
MVASEVEANWGGVNAEDTQIIRNKLLLHKKN